MTYLTTELIAMMNDKEVAVKPVLNDVKPLHILEGNILTADNRRDKEIVKTHFNYLINEIGVE